MSASTLLLALVAAATSTPDAGVQASASASADAGPPVALLLGVASSASQKDETELRTFLVDAHRIVPLGEGLAVPTRNGWLRITLRSHHREQPPSEEGQNPATASKDVVVVSRAKDPDPSDEDLFANDDLEDGCDNENLEALAYVGPEIYSTNETGYSYCGGPYPNAGSTYHSWKLVVSGQEGADIGEFLGPEASNALGRIQAKEPAEDDVCRKTFSPDDWALVRESGQWRAVVSGVGGPHVCANSANEVPLEVSVPQRFAGPSKLPLPWEQLAAKTRKLIDAIGAPNGQFLLLMTETALVLRGSDDSIVTHADLAKRPRVVMAEWVYGAKNIDRWEHEAAAALVAPSRPESRGKPKHKKQK
jgi:hypothetical protein